nr:hypothetical protein [Akkermansiaceae bacterium]
MAKPSETERKALDGLLTEYIDNDVEPEKLRQYLEVRKAHLYYDGKQELVFTQDPERRTIDLTTLGARADDLDEDQDYADFRINIVRGDGRKYKAVLGNRAPNAKAKPDNPNDERALANCRTGDALASVFYSWWRMKQTHRQLCLGQWKSGTQFIHTPYITDGSRYGFHEEPEWGTASGEVAPAGYRCTACGSWSSE